MKVLGIAAAATEARCKLQGNFKTNLALAKAKKGKSKDWGKAANTVLIDLTIIALMAKTEYAAFSVLEEPEAAKSALGQFKQFIEENELEEGNTLRLINSYSKDNRDDIVRGFQQVSIDIVNLQLEGPEVQTMLLDGGAPESQDEAEEESAEILEESPVLSKDVA